MSGIILLVALVAWYFVGMENVANDPKRYNVEHQLESRIVTLARATIWPLLSVRKLLIVWRE